MASPDFKLAWQPSSVALLEKLGLFAYQNATGIPGITDLTISASTTDQGWDLNNCPDLLTLSYPNLSTFTDAGYFNIASCPVLTTITFGSPLASVNSGGGFTVTDCPSLTNLVGITGTAFGCTLLVTNNTGLTFLNLTGTTSSHFSVFGNSSLFILAFSAASFVNGVGFQLDGNALTQSTVDAILAAAVANAGYVSGIIDMTGGTSSAPSVTGLADKATLSGRGVTVNTN